MATLSDSIMRLEQFMSHGGLSAGDLLAEFRVVTLAAGTVECPTSFEDGQIIGVLLTHVNNATINSTQALSTDMVVTTGAITIVGSTASTAVVAVLIFGRPKVS